MTATRPKLVGISRNLCSVVSMTSKNPKVGRPSKGPRRTIGVPVPVPLGDRIERIKELTDKTMGEIVLEVLERHADELDPAVYEAGADQPRIDLDMEPSKKTA